MTQDEPQESLHFGNLLGFFDTFCPLFWNLVWGPVGAIAGGQKVAKTAQSEGQRQP